MTKPNTDPIRDIKDVSDNSNDLVFKIHATRFSIMKLNNVLFDAVFTSISEESMKKLREVIHELAEQLKEYEEINKKAEDYDSQNNV